MTGTPFMTNTIAQISHFSILAMDTSFLPSGIMAMDHGQNISMTFIVILSITPYDLFN